MPFRPRPADKIDDWPPKEPVRQVTRTEIKRMTPEAIEKAREMGALDELLGRLPKPQGGR
jgi:hypothetical protein